MPSNDGWHAHKATFSDTADRTERFYIVHYSPVGAGAYGVDANGIYYTEEEIENLPDKSIIKYIAYTDSELESADRGDGSPGCGFMFEIPPVPGQNIQWATQNLQFDTTLLPNLGNASSDFKGSHNTQAMIDCAIDLGISAPAATYAMEKTITIGDTVLRGFLPAGGQWQKVMSAWTQINAISVAAGRGDLPFKTGNWWSSSQGNATNAGFLSGGTLSNGSKSFAVAYCTASLQFKDGKARVIRSMLVSPTTYLLAVEKLGDGWAKPLTGQGDYLTLHIEADNGSKMDVDLARDGNIQVSWKRIDLSGLGAVKSLTFTMQGSDSSDYGLNTPAYFAFDNVEIEL